MTPFTEVPNCDGNIFVGQTYTNATNRRKKEVHLNSHDSYILTCTEQPIAILPSSPTYYIISKLQEPSLNTKHFALFNLSKAFGANSKELSREMLDVMDKTTKRQFSKTPTRL